MAKWSPNGSSLGFVNDIRSASGWSFELRDVRGVVGGGAIDPLLFDGAANVRLKRNLALSIKITESSFKQTHFDHTWKKKPPTNSKIATYECELSADELPNDSGLGLVVDIFVLLYDIELLSLARMEKI